MSDNRTYASAVPLVRSSPMTFDRRSEEQDELRMRATRYRRLAETLLDPRVIAVVQACARDLEAEAILAETAEHDDPL